MQMNIHNLLIKSITEQSIHPQLVDQIIPGGNLSPEEALQIHVQGYTLRLTESLGQMYEGIWAILGDEEFFKVCKDYILKNPSSFYNINNYGDKFPSYLDELNIFPFLKSLADFENKFFKVFHWPSEENNSIELQLLEKDFKLEFRPFLIHESLHSTLNIWKDRENLKDFSDYILDDPEYLLLFKKKSQVFIEPIQKPELELLKLMAKGFSFCESLEKTQLDFQPTQIHVFFKTLTSHRLVRKISN